MIIKKFGVNELSLGEPLAGVAARLTIAGAATLGAPSEGLDLRLTAQRLDAAGRLQGEAQLRPRHDNDARASISIPSRPAACSRISPICPACRRSSSPSTARARSTLSRSKLDFDAGPTSGRSDKWSVARQGAGRRLTLDLDSRLEGLAPGVIQPVFAGQTSLKGDVQFNDDGSFALPGAASRVGQRAARLRRRAPANDLPRSQNPRRRHSRRHRDRQTRPQRHDQRPARGPDDRWGYSTRATSRPSRARWTGRRRRFHASPNGPMTDETTPSRSTGEAKVNGLALADPALAQAVGRELTLNLRGSASTSRRSQFDALDLSAPRLDASYSGPLGRDKSMATSTSTRRTSAISPARRAARSGRGAHVAADLDGAPRAGALQMTLDAHATKLATALAAARRPARRALDVDGAAHTLRRRLWLHRSCSRPARTARRASMASRRDKADLGARSKCRETSGARSARRRPGADRAALTGAPSDLNADVKANLGEGRLLDRKTSGLSLTRPPPTSPASSPPGVAVRRCRRPSAASRGESREICGWRLGCRQSFADLASVYLAGTVTVGADMLVNGDLSFNASNLDDLSPLVLTKLSGALSREMRAPTSPRAGKSHGRRDERPARASTRTG